MLLRTSNVSHSLIRFLSTSRLIPIEKLSLNYYNLGAGLTELYFLKKSIWLIGIKDFVAIHDCNKIFTIA